MSYILTEVLSSAIWITIIITLIIMSVIILSLIRKWTFGKLTINPVRPQILIALMSLLVIAILAICTGKDNIGIGAVGGLIALAMRLIETDGSGNKINNTDLE